MPLFGSVPQNLLVVGIFVAFGWVIYMKVTGGSNRFSKFLGMDNDKDSGLNRKDGGLNAWGKF
jgi:hypothetical protein